MPAPSSQPSQYEATVGNARIILTIDSSEALKDHTGTISISVGSSHAGRRQVPTISITGSPSKPSSCSARGGEFHVKFQ